MTQCEKGRGISRQDLFFPWAAFLIPVLIGTLVAWLSAQAGAAEAKGKDRMSRTFKADKQYVIFPRARGRQGKDKVFVKINGKMYYSAYDAPLSKSKPDFWTYLDLRLFQGSQIEVTFEGPNAAGIELVKTSDTIPGKGRLYHEPGRPQVHFSPLRGWLNDPSGMIFFKGKWHMYYANTRFANVMAGPNNAWGHAVSTDLLRWAEQPMLLAPIRGKCSFWTGGCAVDVANTTGLGKPGSPALVFSANNGSAAPNAFTQCVFPSIDEGMTCIRNPEMMYKPLPKEDSRRGGGTRDPMIIWYAPEKKWVMVVYNQPRGGKRSFHFFESKDLKNWKETSVLEDMFECPNLFELPVDGDAKNRRWVIYGSHTKYMIGKFDGKAFIPDVKKKYQMHHGDYTASQVFANAPKGRIVQIGWAHCCNYDMEFCQMASFPLDLSLRTTDRGVRLFGEFIPELAGLRKKGTARKDVKLKDGTEISLGDVSCATEIVVEFKPGKASSVKLSGAELNITWIAKNQTVRANGSMAKCAPRDGTVRLHVLLDTPSVEVVSNNGENYIIRSRDYRKLQPNSPLKIKAEGADITLRRLEMYPLQSIHKP